MKERRAREEEAKNESVTILSALGCKY